MQAAMDSSSEKTDRTMQKLFIQMSGAPGSGKSTMARLLRDAISNTKVIDHDVLRSECLNFNMGFEQAAKHAYRLQWTKAEESMGQGFNVIVDSTCNFQETLNSGLALAETFGYTFWYVECRVQDIDLLDQRLQARNALPSQRTGVYCPPAAAESVRHTSEQHRALFERWIESPCSPTSNKIVVDSTENAEEARDYILRKLSASYDGAE